MDFTGDLLDNQLLKLLDGNSDNKWYYDCLSKNPNIMYNFYKRNVRENPSNQWDYFLLSKNKFNKDPIVRERIYKRIKRRELLYSLILPFFNKYISYEIVMLI